MTTVISVGAGVDIGMVFPPRRARRGDGVFGPGVILLPMRYSKC